MNSYTFNIKNVFPGTPAQQKVGIYGTFSLDICVADGILCTITDMKLRKRKEQDIWYIESAYREYTNKEQQTKRAHYAKIWPEKENWPKQEAIVSQVRAAIAEVRDNRGTRTTGESVGQQAPAAPASAPAPADSPW